MAWESYNASFRGIPFEVVSFSDEDIGRVLVTKRIAGSDDYAVEEVSVLQNRFTIDGLLLGNTAQQQWARLKKACEQKGSGDYQHPYYAGRIKVHVENSSVTVDEAYQDTIKFRISFLKAGLPIFEKPRSSAIQDFGNLSTRLRTSANGILEKNTVLKRVSEFARDGARKPVLGLNGFLNGMLSSARFVENLVAGTGNTAYSNNLTLLNGVLSSVPSVNTASSIFSSLTTTFSYMSQISTNEKVYVSELKPAILKKPKKINNNTKDSANHNQNVIAVDTAIKILIVAEISDSIPDITFESYEEAILFKDDVIKTVSEMQEPDQELEYEPSLIISDFINKVSFHIPLVAEDLPNLGLIENVKNKNIVDVLYSNNITKDDFESVVKRNAITNPMRIEKEVIQVLV
jgi:prophage DNA circulation protein